MNKQVEQAYWNGFAIKCAECGVDAEALVKASGSIVGSYWKNRLGATQPDAHIARRAASAAQAGAETVGSAIAGIGHGLYEGIGNLTGTYGQKAQSNRYRRKQGLPVHHGPGAAYRNTVSPTGKVRAPPAAARAAGAAGGGVLQAGR